MLTLRKLINDALNQNASLDAEIKIISNKALDGADLMIVVSEDDGSICLMPE